VLYLDVVESLSGVPALSFENLHPFESEKQSGHHPAWPSSHETQSYYYYETTTAGVPLFLVRAHERP
jgi:hypothetical protein